MTDPTKRIAKWNAKFSPERIKATLDDLRPSMLAAMELQVKQGRDGAGAGTSPPFEVRSGQGYCFGS
jgi:hypothetical protein